MLCIIGQNAELPVDIEISDTLELVPGTWREGHEVPDLGGMYRGYTNAQTNKQRQDLVEYFNSEAGIFPLQLDMIWTFFSMMMYMYCIMYSLRIGNVMLYCFHFAFPLFRKCNLAEINECH